MSEGKIADLCGMQGIVWDFIPERAPHFGGLWEAAVKSLKKHLSRVVGNVKLTFEELTICIGPDRGLSEQPPPYCSAW